MEATDEPLAVATGEIEVDRELAITAHRTSPGRTVFTERGNTEGWIATDYTVDLRR